MATTQPRPTSRLPGWQQQHARRSIEGGAKDGHIWEGMPALLLTTSGRPHFIRDDPRGVGSPG